MVAPIVLWGVCLFHVLLCSSKKVSLFCNHCAGEERDDCLN